MICAIINAKDKHGRNINYNFQTSLPAYTVYQREKYNILQGRLIPQATTAFKLLISSQKKLKLSKYDQLNGIFDFN